MTTPLRALLAAAAVLASSSACPAQDLLPFTPDYKDGWMAKVNGEPILKGDVLARMGKMIDGIRNATQGKPEQFQQEFLELFDRTTIGLVREKVVGQKAKKYGIVISDQEVDVREREEVKQRAGGDREKFKEMLAQSNLTMSEWRSYLKVEMVMEIVLDATMDGTAVFPRPEAALEYFKAHPEEFQHPERVRLRLIPIRAVRGAEERALRHAESLRRQIEAGADFAGLQKWSDTEIQQDAPVDLKWLVRTDLEDELAAAVFQAAKGAVVGPVKGRSGIYLARVEEREDARKISFEEAQKEILWNMRRENWLKERNAAMLKLMRENIIEFSIPHMQRGFEEEMEEAERR